MSESDILCTSSQGYSPHKAMSPYPYTVIISLSLPVFAIVYRAANVSQKQLIPILMS